VRQRALIIDLGLTVLVAIVILIVSPGLAVTAIVALILLAGFGVQGALRSRRQRRARGRARAQARADRVARQPPPAGPSVG
jgi:ABC-type bacteriocin/lantibiotic exporter with double-glycine peptidase domain